MKIQRYLKVDSEFDRGKEVLQRNTDIVQSANTSASGHLCLFVLKSLTNGEEFQSILNHMQHYGRHRFTGPYNPLHLQLDPQDNPLPRNEQYNAVDAISMCHDIYYRDNPAGNHEDAKI